MGSIVKATPNDDTVTLEAQGGLLVRLFVHPEPLELIAMSPGPPAAPNGLPDAEASREMLHAAAS